MPRLPLILTLVSMTLAFGLDCVRTPHSAAPLATSAVRRTPRDAARAALLGRRPKHAPRPRAAARETNEARRGVSSFPSSWTVPTWYLDPMNASGCASDASSGQAATCVGGCSGSACPSGQGPLLTWAALASLRWGCQGNGTVCPRLQQATTVHFESPQPGVLDPVYVYPGLEDGATLTLACDLPAGIATTLTSLHAKNPVSGSPLTTAFAAGGAAGMLAVNTTHPSRAFLLARGGDGGVWLMTQPLETVAPPDSYDVYPPAEVDTWADGDAVTLYTLSSLELVRAVATVADVGPDFTSGLYVYQCSIPTLFGGSSTTEYGDVTTLVDVNQGTEAVAEGSYWYEMNSIVTSYQGGLNYFLGGGCAGSDYLFPGVYDGDWIFGPGCHMHVENGALSYLSSAYLGDNFDVTSGSAWVTSGAYGVPRLYGTFGYLNANAHVFYDAPATGSIYSPLEIGLSTTACSHTNASPDVVTCGIALTAANLDLAVESGGFGGNAFLPGFGSITVAEF